MISPAPSAPLAARSRGRPRLFDLDGAIAESRQGTRLAPADVCNAFPDKHAVSWSPSTCEGVAQRRRLAETLESGRTRLPAGRASHLLDPAMKLIA